MFDARLRPVIDPPLNAMGARLASIGVSANMATVAGGLFGLAAFVAISQSAFMLGLALIVLNRIADGLDGAIARHGGATDFGGFLDIVFDFIFYSLVPLGFAFAEPGNAHAACFLVASFVGTGSSFLAFAIMAERRGISTSIRGAKSFYYLGGLTEGAETIAVLALMCLVPEWFSAIAYVFGGLCWLTTASRVWHAREELGRGGRERR